MLFDIYHAAMVGCDFIKMIHDEIHWIGYIQVADYPGRHEPGTAVIPFKNVFSEIENAGYGGYVGLEYTPSINTHDSLTWLQKMGNTRRYRYG